MLRTLGNGVDTPAAVCDGQKDGRSGQIFVEHVVVHDLLVPDPLAGVGIERHKRVRKQVLTVAIAGPKVGGRRLRGNVDDAADLVERRAGPVRRASGAAGTGGRPRVVPELPLTRDQVECPFHGAAAHIVGSHARRRVHDAGRDVHVPVDNPGRVQRDRRPGRAGLALRAGTEMESALFTERRNQRPRLGVQGVQEVADTGKEAALAAGRILPVAQAALTRAAPATKLQRCWIPLPDLFSRRGIERDDFPSR